MKKKKFFSLMCTLMVSLAFSSNVPTTLYTEPSESEPPNTPSGNTKYEYFDLGLPSGTLWATRNVGAENAWDYGDYFAWGEVKPKEMYSWETYKHANGIYDSQTKYSTSASYDTVDNMTTLYPEDDAASVNMGSNWRMPTIEEYEELIENCTWTWTDNYVEKGVNGYVIIGKNGVSIFLPAAGCRNGFGLYGVGSYGYYWSSSLYGADYQFYAMDLFCSSIHSAYSIYNTYGTYRYYGQSIRAVRCKN